MTYGRAATPVTTWVGLSGVVGVASAVLIPIEAVLPEPVPMPIWALRLLSIGQPMILLLLLAAAGGWAAGRMGLDAPLIRAAAERRPLGAMLRRQLAAAIPAGVAVAALLIGWAELIARIDPVSAARLDRIAVPLVTKLLYGGIAEEVLARWGVMSLVVLLAATVLRMRGRTPYRIGIAVAAALFAAGHLPFLFLILPAPPGWLVAAVLVGNVLPGLLFGWLFWRRGLEAAMMAHALAHAMSTAIVWL